jgi:hypothetical protein
MQPSVRPFQGGHLDRQGTLVQRQTLISCSIAGVLGAAIGATLLAIACRVQVAGWHPGFPAVGAFAGMFIGIGVACRQISAVTVTVIVSAIIPTTIEELAFDGGACAVPFFCAFIAWVVARMLTIRHRRLMRQCSATSSQPLD